MSATPILTPNKSLADYLPSWLPMLMVIFGIISFGVRADAQIRTIQGKTEQYDKMMIDRTDRMARVEEQLKMQGAALVRIEAKLDRENER